jgi:hypothetical protein
VLLGGDRGVDAGAELGSGRGNGHGIEGAKGVAEGGEFAFATGAAGKVRAEVAHGGGGEAVVEERGELFADLGAGHHDRGSFWRRR